MGESNEWIEEDVLEREERVLAREGGMWEAIWRMISFGICIVDVDVVVGGMRGSKREGERINVNERC
jgi:hypothetical protein